MSLHPRRSDPVSEETACVARAAFVGGNRSIRMRDELDAIVANETFTALFPVQAQLAESPWHLALVTIFQFAEGLTDWQAADAIRSRLLSGATKHRLLDTFLACVLDHGLLPSQGCQRTDYSHILTVVRALNRIQLVIELVAETLRAALNSLAVVAPEWRRCYAEPDLVKRYERRAAADPLQVHQAQRRQLAETTKSDGVKLLTAIYAGDALEWLREVPTVEVFRQMWVQNYVLTNPGEQVEQRLRPAALFIASAFDLDAHYARKYTASWVGYKVHFTETCADGTPHLITHGHCRSCSRRQHDASGASGAPSKRLAACHSSSGYRLPRRRALGQ